MRWYWSLSVWVLAFVLTGSLLVYQRLTGPTYPIRVSASEASLGASGKLIRTEETTKPAVIGLKAPEGVTGNLLWRKYPTQDPWTSVALTRVGDSLVTKLPILPAAGKLEYVVKLKSSDGREATIPGDGAAILRYKGPIPGWLLGWHIAFIFLAPLLAFRAALGRVFREATTGKLLPWLVGFMAIGGFLLGPWMQLYAFGAWWTGWPFGEDVTDNKTLVAFVFWALAWWASYKGLRWKSTAFWVAMFVMLAVYLVPHSVRGSQIDWSRTPSANSL